VRPQGGRVLSKYVAKSFADDGRIDGLHRYDLAQGFQQRVQRITARSPNAVIGEASARAGSHPIRRRSSADVPDWQGGPAIWDEVGLTCPTVTPSPRRRWRTGCEPPAWHKRLPVKVADPVLVGRVGALLGVGPGVRAGADGRRAAA